MVPGRRRRCGVAPVYVEALAATAEVDLGWLQGLQHLKSVCISASGGNSGALEAALEQMLPEGARLTIW